MNVHHASRSAVLAIAATALSGTGPRAQQDEFVGVGVYINARASAYAPTPPKTALVFVGEPLEFVVSVHNNTKSTLGTSRAAVFARAVVALRRQGATDGRSTNAALVGASMEGPESALPPGRKWTNRYSVSGAQLRSITPGAYVVAASLPATVIGRAGPRFNDTLSFEAAFEMREPKSNEEMLDFHLHRAYRAKLNGNGGEQQQELQEVLRRHPTSAAAFADLGQMWRLAGDCVRARTALQRAIEILVTGADGLIRVSDVSREDWISGLRSLANTCG